MTPIFKPAICLSLSMSAVGCASFQGAPSPVGFAPLGISAFKPIDDTRLIGRNAQLVLDSATLTSSRNEWVSLQRVLIDQAYSSFEGRLFSEGRGVGFGTNVATLGLTTIATVSGAEGVKTATAAMATALVGGQQSFGKDVLVDKTLPVLITQMRANRSSVLAKILARRDLPYGKWTIGDAQADLEAYVAAGTLQGALTAVAETAATANTDSKKAVDMQMSAPLDQTSGTDVLRNYFQTQDDAEYKRRRTLGVAQLKMLGITGVPPLIFIDQVRSDALKPRFIQLLIENESSPAGRAELLVGISNGIN